jgi:tetrathionate reductase subunit B
MKIDDQEIPYFKEHLSVVKYARTRAIRTEFGKYPDVRVLTFFSQCNHCIDAPCVEVCPTGASYKTDDGVVLVDADKCIKCKYCISACPYGVRKFPVEAEDLSGNLPKENKYGLKLEIPDKCSFCYHRKDGDGTWTPACVENCPVGARVFGDLDDPNSEISKLIQTANAVQYKPEFGTNPKIYYILPSGAANALPPKTADVTVTEYQNALKPLKKLALAAAGVVGAAVIANAAISSMKEKKKEE